MQKKCNFEGCSNEIDVWKTYCEKHYQMLMAQQSGTAVVEEPPKVPVQKVQLQKATIVEKPLPQFQPPKMPVKVDEVKESGEKDKIIRKECLKCAVDLMIATEELDKPYDQLIGQIATLVEDFNKIVSGTFLNK